MDSIKDRFPSLPEELAEGTAGYPELPGFYFISLRIRSAIVR